MSVTLMLKVTLWTYEVYDTAFEMPNSTNVRNKKNYNALAYICSEIG